MPRDPRPTRRETVIPSNSLVASVARYEVGKEDRLYRPVQDWQREAYRHFEICGEARYAATFFGHAMSRATLGVGKRTNKGIDPVTTGQPVARLEELFNGSEGREQMIRDVGIHLTIAGECWLVGRTPSPGLSTWEVVSVLEMNVTGFGKSSKWSIDYGDGRGPVELTDGKDVVIRIWTPHPGKRIEADSPFRSLLPVLAEIEWLTRHIFNQIQSRLAGAGIMWIPNDVTFPPPPPGPDGKARSDTSELTGIMDTLYDAMKRAKADPDHPAAMVPIVAKVPGEVIDKINLMHFWSPLDEKALEMRTSAVHRFALGMDLQPEQIEGMGSNPGTGGGSSNGVSHWGAWQIEESTITMHIEPKLDMLVNALTIGYLRPLIDDPALLVTYDTSSLRLRPDRSKESVELWQNGSLKTAVMLRENGFSEEDAPDEEELRLWRLNKVATGSATPEQVQAALKALGVELETAVGVGNPGQVREARPAPSLVDHPTRPRTPEERVASLLPVTEALALTALSRAGARMRQSAKRKGVEVPDSPAFAVHTAYHCNGTAAEYLADAFPTADIVLAGVTDNPVKIVETLKSYCHVLMAEQAPHTRDRLAVFLTEAL